MTCFLADCSLLVKIFMKFWLSEKQRSMGHSESWSIWGMNQLWKGRHLIADYQAFSRCVQKGISAPLPFINLCVRSDQISLFKKQVLLLRGFNIFWPLGSSPVQDGQLKVRKKDFGRKKPEKKITWKPSTLYNPNSTFLGRKKKSFLNHCFQNEKKVFWNIQVFGGCFFFLSVAQLKFF